MKYRVAWIVQEVKEVEIEANSVEEAKAIWEESPRCYNEDPGDLFFIEDEDGNQVIYD